MPRHRISSNSVRHPLTVSQYKRANVLLDMLYTPKELAEELGDGLTPKRIYQYLIPDHNMPHEKDAQGHVFLHGLAVAKWSNDILEARRKRKEKGGDIPAGYSYCMTCKKATVLNDVETKTVVIQKGSRKLTYKKGKCSQCGRITTVFTQTVYIPPEKRGQT